MKIGRNDKCPCGSGKKYKKCCADNRFEKMNTKIAMTDELKELLIKQDIQFHSIFGREPRGDEPVIFQQLASLYENSWRPIAKIMYENGMNPEQIYAVMKTNRMVTEMNSQNLSESDIQEWNDAIGEFEVLSETVEEKKLLGLYDYFDEKETILEQLAYHIGLCIFVHSNNKSNINIGLDISDYLIFCATKSVKSIQAVKALLHIGFVEDSLSIIRSLYETYLQLIYYSKNTDELKKYIEIQVGLKNGEYSYFIDKKGNEQRNYVINLSTGEKLKNFLTNYEMVTSSPYTEDIELFDYFYNRLSRYVHPNYSILTKYLYNKKFTPTIINDKEEATLYALIFGILIFDISIISFQLDDIRLCEMKNYIQRLKSSVLDDITKQKVTCIDTDVLHIIKARFMK